MPNEGLQSIGATLSGIAQGMREGLPSLQKAATYDQDVKRQAMADQTAQVQNAMTMEAYQKHVKEQEEYNTPVQVSDITKKPSGKELWDYHISQNPADKDKQTMPAGKIKELLSSPEYANKIYEVMGKNVSKLESNNTAIKSSFDVQSSDLVRSVNESHTVKDANSPTKTYTYEELKSLDPETAKFVMGGSKQFEKLQSLMQVEQQMSQQSNDMMEMKQAMDHTMLNPKVSEYYGKMTEAERIARATSGDTIARRVQDEIESSKIAISQAKLRPANAKNVGTLDDGSLVYTFTGDKGIPQIMVSHQDGTVEHYDPSTHGQYNPMTPRVATRRQVAGATGYTQDTKTGEYYQGSQHVSPSQVLQARIAQADALAKVKVSNSTRSFVLRDAANSLTSDRTTILSLREKVGQMPSLPGEFKSLEELRQYLKKKTNNRDVNELHGRTLLAAEKLSKTIGGSQGGQYAIEFARQLLDPSLDPISFQAVYDAHLDTISTSAEFYKTAGDSQHAPPSASGKKPSLVIH